WRKLADKYESLGLEQKHTGKALGHCVEVDYYQSKENEILSSVSANFPTGIHLIDDINSSVMMNGETFNIAIFRIVPNSDGKVMIRLPMYLTVSELRKIKEIFVEVISRIKGIVTEAEMDIEFDDEAVPSSRRRVEGIATEISI
ncbi:MAG: hypothetical protein ACREBJ_08190, partial [Nitrosotalea sp.]